MAYKKAELEKMKEKLKKEKPEIFSSTNKKSIKNSKKVERKVIKSSTYTQHSDKKSLIQWNYNINELVIIKTTNEVGLIVANDMYFNKKCEQNYFYVLMGCKVKKCFGKTIKKLHEV
jgi:hypothetical protein